MSDKLLVSAIVPFSERGRYNNVRELYLDYKKGLDESGYPYEMIYVIDGDFPDVVKQLTALIDEGEKIVIVKLAKWFGEATALSAGFENARGKLIVTLPPYSQIIPSEISNLLNELEKFDMVIGRRWPRKDSRINRFQSWVFHGMLKKITGSSFHDLGCGVRAFRRQIVDEIQVYGDQHRFLPLLAAQRGFRISELDVKQSEKDKFLRLHGVSVLLRRLLDMLTVFFLVKFTKKPLRFFGLIGSGTFALGGISLIYVIFERLVWDISLSDRPALLLSSLLVVLGIQIFAMGLIGELIIFTHAKELKEYTIEEIIGGEDDVQHEPD